jgi:H+/Cl- antiporter ClcA
LSIGLAGLLCGLAIKYFPGRGGHIPADGFGGGVTPPSHLPGVALAALASLALGAVVGPEAPLIALGGGLALLALSWTKATPDPNVSAIIAAAGSAAAISTIFGNPLIAAILFLEILGLGRRKTLLVLLPCLVSSGIGALVFTGLGNWTGLQIGALAIPGLEPAHLTFGDIVWAIPLAIAIAASTWLVFEIGKRTAKLAESRLMTTTIAAGLFTGCCAAVYSLVTGHSPAEVAMSGQATLVPLATDPGEWSTAALVMLLLCKGLAYAVCLGTFRGGPVFPALMLGATFGVLASALVPSIGTVTGVAIGMAAGVAVTRMPITSVLLTVLLLGDAATSQMPVAILAVVAAMVVDEMLTSRTKQLDKSDELNPEVVV